MSNLDERLLAAHASGDTAALIDLYTEAGDTARDPVACSFYLTHAYVFALEAGSSKAPDLRNRLIEMGTESPLHSSSTIAR